MYLPFFQTINTINDETYNLTKLHKVDAKIPKLQKKSILLELRIIMKI